MAYAHMAAVYDALMADTPYDQWLDWIERSWQKGSAPKRIIDLGCGTGTIAIPLAKRGYRVTGVDLSAEMLAIAYDKMRQEQVEVAWVEQDMRELSLPEADAVISLCDSLSYLTEEADVQETFRRVFAHLAPGEASCLMCTVRTRCCTFSETRRSPTSTTRFRTFGNVSATRFAWK